MWICRKCDIKHGDGAETCIGCGGEKKEVGAAIDLIAMKRPRAKTQLKVKVNPLFAAIVIILVPVLIYINAEKQLNPEDHELERAEMGAAIIRINAALDQEERRKEKKEFSGDEREKVNRIQTLMLDSVQIAFRHFSQTELNMFSAFIDSARNHTLTEEQIEGARALLAQKSPQLSGEENAKIGLLVRVSESLARKVLKEQTDQFDLELQTLYKTHPVESGQFSKLMQGKTLDEKIVLTATRLAIKYLSKTEMNDFQVLMRSLDALSQAGKIRLQTLLSQVAARGNRDEKMVITTFQKMAIGT